MPHIVRRLWNLIRPRQLDADLVDEIEFHRFMKQQELEARGMEPGKARFQAQRALGNVRLAREDARAVWIWPWLESVWQDVTYVGRTFRRQPGFTAAVLLTLALGIGANTAMFSVVDAVLLRPAPYPAPDRIAIFGYTFQGVWVPSSSETTFNVWRQHTASLQDVSAIRFLHVNMTGGADPEQVPAAQVNADFFKLFGASTIHGRTFTADEDRPNGGRVLVLSHGFWQRRFGGDPGIVGRRISLDDAESVVVGILAPSFDTAIFNASPDVWVPLQLDAHSTFQSPSLRAAARLRPGITWEAANAEARLAGAEFGRQFPNVLGPNDTFALAPFQDVMVEHARPSLLVLLGAVGLVLLIAGGNVANLLLVRASVRQRELAIRTSIGASRGRIVRQLLTESLVLSLAGGALGLALGGAGVRALLILNHGGLPRIGAQGAGVTVDWRVLTFTLLVATATGLLFGVLPALQASRAGLPHVTLAEGSGRAGISRRTGRARSLLVMTEMALAIVLLVGAALLIRTFVALGTVNRGFNTRDVLTLRMTLSTPRFSQTSGVVQLVRDGVRRVNALPGVASAGAAVALPLESDWLSGYTIAGQPSNGRPPGLASFRLISPGYLAVFQIPLIRGRAFTDRDGDGAPLVAIINEAMARQISPRGDPLNTRINQFPGLVPVEPPRQIVGIVGDVRDGLALNRQTRPTVYVPMAQMPAPTLHTEPLAWVVRTRTDPYATSPAIAKALQQTSGGLPVTQIRNMDAVSTDATARTRFQMVLMAIFGGLALALAAIGVYGVMAYTVQQRAHEMGVRLALGAESRTVQNMVIGEGMRVALPGILVGFAAAFGLARVLDGFLFGVTVHDPLVFASVPLLLTAVAFVAVWLPSRLASRVNPVVALRSE
jgi:putative ABC transport system permease protein